MQHRFDLDHHRKTDKSCFMDNCKNQSYEHIPYIHGVTFDNCKDFGHYPMIACIKHFKELWAGAY